MTRTNLVRLAPLIIALAQPSCAPGVSDPDVAETEASTGNSSSTTADIETTSSSGEENGAAFVPMPDVGSEGWPPTYRCDDEDANVPPDGPCEDAVPGDEASVEDRAAVIDAFGTACRLERICGALWGVDCGAASDGLYYYVEQQSLAVVATCGGACMTEPCLDCPPEGWVCPTY